jgi:hypothetical protein
VPDGHHGQEDGAPTLRRTLRVQAFENPFRDFSIESNFAAVPVALGLIKDLLRAAILPAVDVIRTKGIAVDLS